MKHFLGRGLAASHSTSVLLFKRQLART